MGGEGVYTKDMHQAAPHHPWRRRAVLFFALATTPAWPGCQCILDEDLTQLRDAGFEEPDAGPPPPIFPLKPGDQLVVPVMGGRTNSCGGGGGGIGECDRTVRASFQITAVELNNQLRWEVTADALYEGTSEVVPASALLRLALEKGAPFNGVSVATPVSAAEATFTTDRPATLDGTFGPNNFPFFQGFNDGNDGDDGTVFNEAALAFAEAIRLLDPDADISTQIGAGRMQAYFKDELGGPPMLHKLLVEVHPMGFVCGWDERLIPFTDGMPRAESSFTGIDNPPLVASFFQPQLTRDGVSYQCSCFNRTCRGNGLCLDPTDPDAAPGDCP
jgi:hypothetical protein